MDKIDIIIIGAGIAGIQSAYYIQKNCPHLSYKILESRSDLGGTWDLMKFPGVRSDSDMYTYGYSFNPWQGKIVGSGKEIKNYIDQTAQKFNIKEHIVFDSKVISLEWDKDNWAVTTADMKYKSKFIVCCTGSIDYDNPYIPEFNNQEVYQGKIVHPQFWDNTDCRNKNVTIIGSGCTAVTMAPSIVKLAKSVTLIQRSPGWITNINSNEQSTRIYKSFENIKNYLYARLFKEKFKKRILASNPIYTNKRIPKYDFWDQRPTCSLDHDYFNLMYNKNVKIKYQEIDNWTEDGIKLDNGETIDSDITVLATGLNIKLLGGVEIKVNGKQINVNDTSWYRGMMFSGIPNLFSTFGYVNFSWTARCELIGKRISKTINYMTKKKLQTCTPKYLGEISNAPLQSNYILRAMKMKKFPSKTYKFYQNFWVEWISFNWSRINDGALDFK